MSNGDIFPTPKHRLGKGWIVFLVVLAFIVAVFCPKKLCWLCPIDKVTFYQYRTSFDEQLRMGNDCESLRARMQDTWVIWTGWVSTIYATDTGDLYLSSESNGKYDLCGEFVAITGEVTPPPSQSLFGKFLDNEHAIYQPVVSQYMNRYVSLGDTLFELIPDLST